MNEIRIEAGKRNCVVIRLNVGKFMKIDGTYFDTGIPTGFPDLMVLTDDGRTIFIETKIHPRKPSKQQKEMISLLKSKGHNAHVIYDITEFLNVL